MHFVSTEKILKEQPTEGSEVSFKEAVLRCLPPEGGLFVPESVPDLRPFFLHMGEETTFPELAAVITPLLFEGELNPLSASRVAEKAYSFEPELKQLDETFSVLNLYNGPTGIFKDFGINFLAALLEELLEGEKAMVVAAARGNTGVAIARAFENKKGITAVLLYPDEPIYGLDKTAYANRGGNLIPIRVKGNLDDCQKLISLLIQDRDFAGRYRITAANSINAGRLLPQSFYFLYSFIKLKKRISGELIFSIPSGNFGNLIAALYAWKFGMPVNGYIAVTNSANSSITPALDVCNPSNNERLESFYKSAPAVMRNMVFPETADDESTLKAMKTAWETYGIHLDPHGAAAFAAARRFAGNRDFDGHIVLLSTAHPAKYADLALKISGKTLTQPENLASLDYTAEPIAEIPQDLEALESAIAGC